jgi:hypothetical protein
MSDAPRDPDRCTCPEPIVVIRAERKGAPMRVCGRCGLGLKVTF